MHTLWSVTGGVWTVLDKWGPYPQREKEKGLPPFCKQASGQLIHRTVNRVGGGKMGEKTKNRGRNKSRKML